MYRHAGIRPGFAGRIRLSDMRSSRQAPTQKRCNVQSRGLTRAVAVCLFLALLPQMARAERVALVGAKIYIDPSTPPIENGVVVVDGRMITAVGPKGRTKIPGGVRVIDCVGATITAGFWNSHVHFTDG